MKNELNYFGIDGGYGGNQSWYTNIIMNMGGCAAATACDTCIYFAREREMPGLYPFAERALTKADYIAFGQQMKPYLHPRVGGVKKLAWYIDGFRQYIAARNAQLGTNFAIGMREFAGERTVKEAAQVIRGQINQGYPVPFLMLRHEDPRFRDFGWHWFLLTGYEETPAGLTVVAATYGAAHRLPLNEFWQTGYKEKGGLIIYD